MLGLLVQLSEPLGHARAVPAPRAFQGLGWCRRSRPQHFSGLLLGKNKAPIRQVFKER